MKILLVAPVSGDDGYSNAAKGMYSIFMRLYEKNEISGLQIINLKEPLQNIDQKILEQKYDIAFCTIYPLELLNPQYVEFIRYLLQGSRIKLLSVVWETSSFPKAWDDIWALDLFDGYLTPTHFLQDMLKEKTNKPVHYYPHLLDENLYTPIDVKDKVNEAIFKVLYIGQYTIRKGIGDAIIAFTRELGKEKDAELYIKYTQLTNIEIPFDTYLKNTVFTNINVKDIKARIYHINQTLPVDELNEFSKSMSVLLYPTRGEGFGLVSGEAMLLGLPVIYTNWGACKEVTESPYNYPVTYYEEDAHSMAHFSYDDELKYAVPIKLDIRAQLRKAYNSWKENKELYYTKLLNNRNIIIEKYGINTIMNIITNIVNTYREV